MAILTANSDFVLPDEGLYVFSWEEVGEPYYEANPFFDAFCNEYDEDHPDEPYDRVNDPLNKKQRRNMKVIFRILSDGPANGTDIFQWFNPTMGKDKKVSNLRPFVGATLGVTITDAWLKENPVDTADLQDCMFQAMLTHKPGKNGMKAVVSSPIPYRQQQAVTKPEPAKPATNGGKPGGIDKTGKITDEQKARIKELCEGMGRAYPQHSNNLSQQIFKKFVIRLSQAEAYEVIAQLEQEAAADALDLTPYDRLIKEATDKGYQGLGPIATVATTLFPDFDGGIQNWTPEQQAEAAEFFASTTREEIDASVGEG